MFNFAFCQSGPNKPIRSQVLVFVLASQFLPIELYIYIYIFSSVWIFYWSSKTRGSGLGAISNHSLDNMRWQRGDRNSQIDPIQEKRIVHWANRWEDMLPFYIILWFCMTQLEVPFGKKLIVNALCLEENMVICFEDQETGRCLKWSPSGDKNLITKMYCRIYLTVIVFHLKFSSLLKVFC